jgi:hypothetical protein
MLKIITVRQPWAWLIFHGKDVENRSWVTPYRGPCAIHAAAGMTAGEYDDCRGFLLRAGLITKGGFMTAPQSFSRVALMDRSPVISPRVRFPQADELVRSAILGVADVTGFGPGVGAPSVWFFGPRALTLANMRELPKPLRYTGGVRRIAALPAAIEEEVWKSLAA